MANVNEINVVKKITIEQEGGASSTKPIGAEAQYIDVSYDSQGNIITDITDPEVVVDPSKTKTLPNVLKDLLNNATNFVGTMDEWNDIVLSGEWSKYETADII